MHYPNCRKNKAILFLLLFASSATWAQKEIPDISRNWLFRKEGTKTWFKATVPGTVHTDLLKNQLIPDPFYRDNERKLGWIDSADWEYQTNFEADETLLQKKHIDLVFDGLDTYAAVYLNQSLVLESDNMFLQWAVNIKPFLVTGNNHLLVKFHSAKRIVDSIAKARLPQILPDNNRVYARKAQFQFGWDWGPAFIGAGIWKKPWIDAYQDSSGRSKLQAWRDSKNKSRIINMQLVQVPDEGGVSFCFRQNGKPFYAKGANWIPAHIFLPEIKETGYRHLLQMAKDANMNMLRVWGGGIYESDEFYDICDELGIRVWQDFMFAGAMYPGDARFMENVRQEVKYQVERLRHHPCIVLWCGNNEINEAWNNWGWQKQFNIHGLDSARIWREYLTLFNDSLRSWVNELDCSRPYIESSPEHGWGRKESFREGDSHYWGLWWGLQDWEQFSEKTGRFVSEYGMQSMPNEHTLLKFTSPSDRWLFSPVIQAHQKATDGFKKLNHYLVRYFTDSLKLSRLSLEQYRYLTQCLQYYILKNSIATHRSKMPYNMGTLLWQLNDCWPVTSWSIIDHSGAPKAAWYGVKSAYRDDVVEKPEHVIPKEYKLKKPVFNIQYAGDDYLTLQSNTEARFIFISLPGSNIQPDDNYFDLQAGEVKKIKMNFLVNAATLRRLKVVSLFDIIGK